MRAGDDVLRGRTRVCAARARARNCAAGCRLSTTGVAPSLIDRVLRRLLSARWQPDVGVGRDYARDVALLGRRSEQWGRRSSGFRSLGRASASLLRESRSVLRVVCARAVQVAVLRLVPAPDCPQRLGRARSGNSVFSRCRFCGPFRCSACFGCTYQLIAVISHWAPCRRGTKRTRKRDRKFVHPSAHQVSSACSVHS